MARRAAFTQTVKKAHQQVSGEIGIAVSGGGSRAYSAVMGQLRALEFLKDTKGSYLSRVAAIVTTSGASWLGIPFVFPNGVADRDFLNEYVDPSLLVPIRVDSEPVAAVLNELPAGNADRILEADLDVESVVLAMCYLHILVFGVYHHYVLASEDNIAHLPMGAPMSRYNSSIVRHSSQSWNSCLRCSVSLLWVMLMA